MDNYILELEGLFDRVNETLPDGFKMPKMDKFDGTGNPKNHVRICSVKGFKPNNHSHFVPADPYRSCPYMVFHS